MRIYKIDGRLVVAFPSAAAPYRLTRRLGGLTERDYDAHVHAASPSRPRASVPVDQGARPAFKLGSGYFVYRYPGYVHVGGDVNEAFGGVFTLKGRRTASSTSQTAASTSARTSRRASSSGSAAARRRACRAPASARASRSERSEVDQHRRRRAFGPFEVLLSLTACRWSEFEDAAVFDGKRPRRRPAALKVTIKRGDPSRAIRLDGAGGAPRVRVTAPGGQVLESPAGAGTALTPAVRILGSERIRATVVGLKDPKPGTYTLDLLPGSPAITKVTEAEDPPPAHVSARVRGTGRAHARLRRAAPSRPEGHLRRGRAGGQAPARHGHRRPRDAELHARPGHRPRRIEAQFELAGVGAETRTVAAFSPPSQRLGRPGAVTVRRRGRGCGHLDARRGGRALRARHHADQRRAACHAHPPGRVTVAVPAPAAGG